MRYIIAILLSIFVVTAAQAKTPEQQIKCLATNMYYEARGEGIRGMTAVGHVVMNRVESGKFPSSPCSVVYQRTRSVCQFSWVCGKKAAMNKERYAVAMELARKIYFGNSADITRGALFFHATYVRPYWSRVFKKTAHIGNHIFYRG